jgi:putative membrane protein
MKNTHFAIAVLSAALTIQACNSPDKKEVKKDGTVGEVGSGMDAKSDTGFNKTSSQAPKDANPGKNLRDYTNESHVEPDDAAFLKTAAMGGMMEVELGKIAQKSTNPKVKAFAAMMVTDHSRANKELQRVAAKVEIILPTEYFDEDKKHMQEMKSLTGAAFDKHYIDMMVTDHAKTVSLFKQATETRSDDVKNFATATLPVLDKHFKQAVALQKEVK